MPDLGPDAGLPAVPTPDTNNPWQLLHVGLGALAVGLVTYVGFTVAQVVSMSSSALPVAAQAPVPPDAPAYVAPPPPPSATPSPAASKPASEKKSAEKKPGEKSGEKPAADTSSAKKKQQSKPARAERGSTEPTAKPTARATERSSKSSSEKKAPARATAERTESGDAGSRNSRQQRREIKRATWADRQIAAMLRDVPTSPISWYAGGTWVNPTMGYRLTATFGESGRHWSSTHSGLDFAAPTGTPVRSVYTGTVTAVGWGGAYGNRIQITHPDGTETWYCHLSQMYVSTGTPVGTGTVIGTVGATGNTTGPPLHLEVRSPDGTPLAPYQELLKHGVRP